MPDLVSSDPAGETGGKPAPAAPDGITIPLTGGYQATRLEDEAVAHIRSTCLKAGLPRLVGVAIGIEDKPAPRSPDQGASPPCGTLILAAGGSWLIVQPRVITAGIVSGC